MLSIRLTERDGFFQDTIMTMTFPVISRWRETKSVTREGRQLEVLQNRPRKMMFGHKENEVECRRLYNSQTS